MASHFPLKVKSGAIAHNLSKAGADLGFLDRGFIFRGFDSLILPDYLLFLLKIIYENEIILSQRGFKRTHSASATEKLTKSK